MTYNIIQKIIWLIVNIFTGIAIYFLLGNRVDRNLGIAISAISASLLYVHPIPILFLGWKYTLPKKALAQYIWNFGLPYDTSKEMAIWKNMAGFDRTWILDEQVAHLKPVDHIDFIYSTIKVPGIKPEHVCIIANSTGSIFVDLL